MAIQLTNGALKDILQQRGPDKPVLQVLNMKKIQSEQQSVDRYRLQMSDGTNFQPCMLATQMNEKIDSKEMDRFSVVRVVRYLCNTIHNRRIIILINLEVLCKGCEAGGAIGQPTALDLLKVPDGNDTGTTGGGGASRVGAGGGGGGGAARGQNYTTHNGSTGVGGPPHSFQPSHSAGAGNAVRTAAPPKSSYSSAAPPSRPGFDVTHSSSSQRSIFPIASLSPYQTKWTIRVRVASKPSIRTWSNSRGEGRVLSVDLVDETGEIRASGFNEVADRMQAQLEMGQVYYISRGRLKPANKKFTSIKNDYEMSFTEETEVELCTEGASDLPTLQYSFTNIAGIETTEPNTLIDVIGVCKSAADLATVISRSTSKKLSKRDIQLMDRSGKVVTLTLWGAEAEGFDGSTCPVIAVKGCKVSDFGGRSLSTQFNSLLTVDPDIPEAHQLRGWFDSVGKNKEVSSISDQRSGGGQATGFLTIEQVRDLDLGHGEKPDYFNCKSTVTFCKKDNCLYKACPNTDCNKKVTEHDGQYTCEKCNQTFPNFKYRIILSINTADCSGSQWLTCFQETAMEVLGVSAEQLGEMRETDEQAFDNVFQQANFKEYVFRVRAKVDTFNDEQRLKCYCVGAAPVNYAQETRRRIEELKAMLA